MPIFFAVQRGPAVAANARVMMPSAVTTIGSSPDADVSFPGVDGLAPLHVKVWLDGRDMKLEALDLSPVSVGGVKAVTHQIKLNTVFDLGANLSLKFEHTPSKSSAGGTSVNLNAVASKSGENKAIPALRPPTLKTSVQQAREIMDKAIADKAAAQAATLSKKQDPPTLPTKKTEDKSQAAKPSGNPEGPVIADTAPVTTPSEPPPIVPAAEKSDAASAKPVAAAKPVVAAKPAAPASKDPPRAIAEVQLPYGEPITLEELNKIPVFNGMPGKQMAKLPGSVVRRKFKKGEIICREGDYGFTAFYILQGACEVYIGSPLASVTSVKQEDKRGGFFGLLREFKHKLTGRKVDPTASTSRRMFIPVDGPEDLPMDNPIGKLKAGDLFGEMSCTSLYPRSATVRATEDCEMLEMLNNVLFALKDNPTYKVRYDADYRHRALSQHLRGVSILSGLDEEFINQLKERVELVSYKKGEIVVKEGDDSDAFYLIRFGNVKVSKHYAGGEVVLNYLGRSEFFGEVGLLHGGKRKATCTSLDHVECVRIRKPDFDFMLSWYDDIRENIEKIATERERAGELRAEGVPNVKIKDFLGQGLMQAQSLLLLDLNKCTRCDECVHACSDSHESVTRLVREGLRFDNYLVATSCRSCLDPVCMPGCPVGSIHRQESMEILIEDWCIGCGLCARNCPYGNISMHAFPGDAASEPAAGAPNAVAEMTELVKKAAPKDKKKAVTCDLCHELEEPSCVYACPHDAAHRVDARKFFASGGDVRASKV